jgi:hypothetical protein
MSGVSLSFTANVFILMILYDFSLLPARKVESRVQIKDRCARWKISSAAQNLVLHALQF